MAGQAVPAGALSKATIRSLIDGPTPLVAAYVDLDDQLQPNGIDLTLQSVWVLSSSGTIGIESADCALPPRREIEPDGGRYVLAQGTYIVRLNEILRIPNDLVGLGHSRSSLLRCGVVIHNAVWDAGYAGRSEVLLAVLNPSGFAVDRNARIMQLVFLRLDRPTSVYGGAYQGENLRLDEQPEDK